MRKLFPPMQVDRPVSSVIGIIVCWIVSFFVVPFFLIPFAWGGVWGSVQGSSWVEIIYQILKAGVVVMLLKEFLSESFFFMQTDAKRCIGHAALAVALMIAVVAVEMVWLVSQGMQIPYLLNAFPLVEMAATFTPGYLAYVNPIFGTISLVLAAPISTCGLLYVVGFAPACSKKTWLGYLCIAVVILIPALIGVMWQTDMALAMDMYLLQLPVHLIACWAYQRTDNIWTPIFALAILNLLSSLANIFLI